MIDLCEDSHMQVALRTGPRVAALPFSLCLLFTLKNICSFGSDKLGTPIFSWNHGRFYAFVFQPDDLPALYLYKLNIRDVTLLAIFLLEIMMIVCPYFRALTQA